MWHFVSTHSQQIGAVAATGYIWAKAMLKKYTKIEISPETDIFVGAIGAILGFTVGV